MEGRAWLICISCGYSAEVFQEDIDNFNECPICGEKMALDMNEGRKLEEESLGDNFPNVTYSKFTKEPTETEVKNNINLVGEKVMETIIEAITIIKLRIKYRNIFIKLGYDISEKDIFIEKEGKLYVK